MNILLIVTGGIAAVKIYDFVRLCRHKGHDIQVILTQSAEYFITETALMALTGNKVHVHLFEDSASEIMNHITLARWADKIIVAPCTANMIAKMAHGVSDDLATTTLLASDKPIYLAPAMNSVMWHNVFVQNNLKILEQNTLIHIIHPVHGEMACGEIGIGKMAEPETIYQAFTHTVFLPLQDLVILITAGPTVESIDPVRYLSNHSSGKQGYALAQSALNAGAKVILVSGPTHIPVPIHDNCCYIPITTATEMYESCLKIIEENTIDMAICAAAVCDWKPEYHAQKQKKSTETDTYHLTLRKNPDILQAISQHKNRPLIVSGFAAETENHHAHAMQKLIRKGCDVIFLNDVSKGVFGQDHNHIKVYTPLEHHDLGAESKTNLASQMMAYLLSLYHRQKNASSIQI